MIRRLGTNTFKDHLNWAAGSPTATPTQGPLGICKTLPRVTLVYHRWLSTIFWHVCCTHLSKSGWCSLAELGKAATRSYLGPSGWEGYMAGPASCWRPYSAVRNSFPLATERPRGTRTSMLKQCHQGAISLQLTELSGTSCGARVYRIVHSGRYSDKICWMNESQWMNGGWQQQDRILTV